MSKEGLYTPDENEPPVVITKDIQKSGYQSIITQLGDFGFFPKQTDIYWETPFTNYNYANYSFETAKEQSSLKGRKYSIIPDVKVPDVSYLVEPEEGIWFLAIDANVYIPEQNNDNKPDSLVKYKSASIGYNNVLTHKKHLFSWVESVAQRAKQHHKKLVVFSHYPMIDFNDDASEHIKNLMGDGKMQLHRVPHESVAEKFAQAGIKLHFGGHLHINDTGVRDYKDYGLVNVQIPSLAAYIPAYKIATYTNNSKVNIQTIKVGNVKRFNELFQLYQIEHDYLQSIGAKNIWDISILKVNNYKEYTQHHLKQLLKLRYLKKDWPQEIKNFLLKSTGYDILKKAGYSFSQDSSKMISQFEKWNGEDLIYDFYRLRSADKLAIEDISLERIKQYELVLKVLLQNNQFNNNESDKLMQDLKEFALVFNCFLNGAPANNFSVDLKLGRIEGFSPSYEKKIHHEH